MTAVFGLGLSEEALVSAWCLPSKTGRFFDAVDNAVQYAMTRRDDQDVYVGTCLYRSGITEGRGKSSDVVGVPALWADVDYGGEGAKKRPPTIDDARKIIDGAGLKPSILVHSGHGLQAWWLLSEVIDPAEGAVLCRAWNETLQQIGVGQGYEVDSTYDLARVMRLPGTVNRKAEPVDVTLIEIRELRYDADDVETWCHPAEYTTSPNNVVSVDVVKIGGQIDLLKIDTLRTNDPRFADTWERKRKDLKDQSASAYDLAICHAAMGAGCSDQECADLILTWRRKHGEDEAKANRRDYLTRTIGRAKESRQSQIAIAEMDTHPAPSADRMTPSKRTEILRRLSKVFQVPVTGWIKQGREQSVYSLRIGSDQEVLIGSSRNVLDRRAFEMRLYESVNIILPKKLNWRRVCEYLASVCELIENEDASMQTQFCGWLLEYLAKRPPIEVKSLDERHGCVFHGRPFVDQNTVYVNSSDFARYLRISLDEHVTLRDLWPRFRSAGWSPRTVWLNHKNVSSTKSYWSTYRDSPFFGSEQHRNEAEAEDVTGSK